MTGEEFQRQCNKVARIAIVAAALDRFAASRPAMTPGVLAAAVIGAGRAGVSGDRRRLGPVLDKGIPLSQIDRTRITGIIPFAKGILGVVCPSVTGRQLNYINE